MKAVTAKRRPGGASKAMAARSASKVLTTSSGVRVTAIQRGVIPLVAVRLLVAAGSTTDPVGKDGLSDFTARLMRRGTKKHSADELNEAVEFVGASLSLGSQEDYLTLSISTSAEHFEDMLEVLAEVARTPSFPERELQIEKARAIAQFANDLDDPALIADRELTRAMYGAHPYGHDVGGSARTVKTFTREDLVRFHRERIGPKVAWLTVVGPLDPERVTAAADRVFSGWTGGPDAPQWPPEVTQIAPVIRVVDKPDQTQSQVRFGGPGFAKVLTPGYFPSILMNVALGAGFTSRLVNEIRVNRGLSYGASSHFDALKTAGSFQVSSFTKTETTGELVQVALDEVEKMRKGGLTAPELKNAQTYLRGLYPLRTETNEALAAAIGDMALYGLGDDWVEQYRDRVGAVTLKQAAEAARAYCFARKPALVVVGNAAKVVKQLKKYGKPEVVKVSELE